MTEEEIRARNALVEENTGLVHMWARKYYYPSMKWSGMEMEDFIQFGLIGMMKAASSYDWTRGVPFRGYAYPSIKQAMLTALFKKGKLIRLPVRFHPLNHLIGKATDFLQRRFGREPTTSEIAFVISVPEERVLLVLEMARQSQISLNAPPRGKHSEEFSSMEELFGIFDETIEEQEKSEELRFMVKELLDDFQKMGISEQNRKMFVEYWGLNGNPRGITYQELADKYGMTRQGAQQNVDGVIKKIRKKLGISDAKKNSKRPRAKT